MKKILNLYQKGRLKVHNFFTSNSRAPVIEIVLLLLIVIGSIFLLVLIGMYFGIFNVRGSISERNKFFTSEGVYDKTAPLRAIQKLSDANDRYMSDIRKSSFPDTDFSWIESSEWTTLKAALLKDKDVIKRAADDAGISPRVLVSVVIAEQLRFFTSDRESFKKFFEPLKILGTLSQFSLGVSGVKQETAVAVEEHLKDVNSPYYIGSSDREQGSHYKKIMHVLDVTEAEKIEYGTDDISKIRFNRLTDSHDHYYSYLYTALFIRQVEEQWKKAGFDISDRPEILATLFNLGFDKSVPKSDPQVAGSEITINTKTYTFGELAFSFYYSGEMALVFGY